MSAQFSIEVWRDSRSCADVRIYRGQRRLERVLVIPGDCLDGELDGDMAIFIRPGGDLDADVEVDMPAAEHGPQAVGPQG